MRQPIRILAALDALAGAGLAVKSTRALSAAPEEVELEVAKVFVEWNSTASDFGIHFSWDGDAWKSMTVKNTSGSQVLNIRTNRNLRAQGLTEGFFESAEPPTSELSMEEFFERFPEGTFEFEGRTLEGGDIVGEAEFTHTLPAPPTNLSPAAGAVVSNAGFTISFTSVSVDTDGNPISVAYYEVELEKENDEPILQTFDVILRPSQTSVAVPAAFLEPTTAYKFEVIAVLEGGNSTITESGTFTTN
jgi:hypothetical protein